MLIFGRHGGQVPNFPNHHDLCMITHWIILSHAVFKKFSNPQKTMYAEDIKFYHKQNLNFFV